MIKNLWKEGKWLTMVGIACCSCAHLVQNPLVSQGMLIVGGLLVGSKDPKYPSAE